MSLLTHPNDSATQTTLLYYDYNFSGTPSDQQDVTPFSVPMFANHPNGTIVRDFNIKAKLPNESKQLAYVMNDGTDVSEAKIAPFLQFMYQDNTDSANEQIRDETKIHAEKHIKYLFELESTKAKLAENNTDDTNQEAMRDALKKYLQYPKEQINQSAFLGSPQFPYEISFTIDGINGFKYGDVLQFEGIPARYKSNTVFIITNISHTVDNAGLWTTKISCLMKPVF